MAAAGSSGASPFALVEVDDPDPDDELELLLSDPEPLLDEDDGSKGVAVVVPVSYTHLTLPTICSV